jgi:hypothetical protein
MLVKGNYEVNYACKRLKERQFQKPMLPYRSTNMKEICKWNQYL